MFYILQRKCIVWTNLGAIIWILWCVLFFHDCHSLQINYTNYNYIYIHYKYKYRTVAQWYECVLLYSGRQRHKPKLELPFIHTYQTYIHSTHIRTTQIHLHLYLALYIVHAKLTFILWLRSTNDFYITWNTKKKNTFRNYICSSIKYWVEAWKAYVALHLYIYI